MTDDDKASLATVRLCAAERAAREEIQAARESHGREHGAKAEARGWKRIGTLVPRPSTCFSRKSTSSPSAMTTEQLSSSRWTKTRLGIAQTATHERWHQEDICPRLLQGLVEVGKECLPPRAIKRVKIIATSLQMQSSDCFEIVTFAFLRSL